MYHCGMRKVGERHVAYQVDLMVWSNRLDLLALSNFKGEIQIHRLHWQKVWNLPPLEENVSVRAMAWRPDGKALAIGYSSGTVYIVDIEDKDNLDKYVLEQETLDDFEAAKHCGVTCLTWAVRNNTLESASEYNLYDDASIFLQPLPQTSGYKNQATEENVKDFKEVQDPTQLNMLLVGYGTGYIYMNIFGTYPYGTIHLAQVAKDDFGEYKVLDINLSDDFSVMQVLYIDKFSNNVLLSLINTSVLSAYAEEMYLVANKHRQIVQLLSYLDQTMISITEAWEHILLEMDTKMAFYASCVPDGGVSADLLELLMLGIPSDDLQVYLLQKLTANDLKKFGNSVELSYSTIQKLVLKQLTIVGQSLAYYLSELRGLTRIPDRFKILGLDEGVVTAAIKACCAFLNKSLELQKVIDVSMRNYKAFLRWLFVVIVRLLDEQTPSEITKSAQQDITHIAEFLYNFDNVQDENDDNTKEKTAKFNLERLGQYLQDQELTILPEDDDNPWHKFLRDNSCLLKDNDTIFSMTEFRKFSLVQQQKYLRDALGKVFDVSQKDIGKHFSVLHNIRCYEDQMSGNIGENLRISQTFDTNEKRFMMAFMNTSYGRNGIYFMSVNMKETCCTATAMKYYLSSSLIQDANTEEAQLAVLDLQFYSGEYLSVLVQHPTNDESTIFIQLPLKILIENSSDFNIKSKSYLFCDKLAKKDISPLLDPGIFKVLDKMDGFRIAVSGSRKVAIVLAKNMRKVRVFEMEIDGDEEEDETLDTTPQSVSNNDQEAAEKQDSTAEDITFI